MQTRKVKKYPLHRPKKYPVQAEGIFSGLSGITKDFVPEIKIRFNKGKQFLGKVTSSVDVADFIRKTYGQGKVELQEQFIALYLNYANEIMGFYRHTIGSVNGVLVDKRLLLVTGIKSNASSIILAHNHPSGNPKPSQADKTLTEEIKKGADLLGLKVLDHIIVTMKDYFSFADNGIL